MSTRGYIVGAVGIAMVAVSALTAMTTATAVEPAQVGRYSTIESAVPESIDSRYLATMRVLTPGTALAKSTDADLAAFARGFCANGADVSGLSQTAEVKSMFGTGPDSVRVMFRIMAAYYCPALLPKVG